MRKIEPPDSNHIIQLKTNLSNTEQLANLSTLNDMLTMTTNTNDCFDLLLKHIGCNANLFRLDAPFRKIMSNL